MNGVVTQDILTLAALVAAYVGVAKGFGLPAKWTHLVAIGVAAVFVLLPDAAQEKLALISVVGLTASGAYNYVKQPTKKDGKEAE
jgi:predicted metal-binding membrane protein